MSGDHDHVDQTPVMGVPTKTPFTQLKDDFEKLEKTVEQHTLDLVVIQGKNGENGRIGSLRATVGKIVGGLGAVALIALGAAGGAYVAVDRAGQERGAELERQRVAEKRLQAVELFLSQRLGYWPGVSSSLPPSPAAPTGGIP